MTTVFLRPDAETIQANNGIGRVVHAQYKYLKEFDIELVGNESQADVVAGHTHDYGASKISACHLHGLYWQGDAGSGEYDNWHREANTRIIAAMRRARAITVPSNWVGECIRRDMRIAPTIIGHGIEVDEWAPGENQGYVLWAKNRPSDVCNPIWPYELARRGVKVFSTFGPKGVERPPSLGLLGELKADAMKEMLRRSDVYLATTKETFGIQTLEAMSCAVPVLGFDWGGTAGLVQHERTGYLAKPGDIDGLIEGLAYIRAHRDELGANARAAAAGYGWKQVIGQYAALYHRLAGAPEPQGVAVVIPCHNYAQWVGECLESVLAQTYRVEEIIVVDDGSTDASRDIVARYGPRVRLIAQPNSGVAAARNAGIAATAQPFIVCLDADDTLDSRYVEACRSAMLADRGLGLAWTGMSIVREGQPETANVWTGGFDWEWQATPRTPPATTIPTGAMFRRALWERAGGYRQQYAPGEDAEFYTRGLAVGFTARQVTDVPLYRYRDHGAGAHKRLTYKPIDDWKPWMRDKAYPLAAPAVMAPDVRSYSDPKVSVIIPVGPGHGQYLPDALESLLGQSMREWEVIVLDDTDDGDVEHVTRRYPFARFYTTEAVGDGPGAARNRGLAHARAPLCLFLDADDQLAPGALASLCKAYAESGGRYVYGDWQAMGEPDVYRESEYDPAAWLDFEAMDGKHSVTVLMATADAQALRFDEQLSGWEDWDFFIRAALAGVHGQRVPAVTLFVRRDPNGRTARVLREPAGLLAQLRNKYGGDTVGKSCCGGNADALLAAKAAWNGTPAEQAGGLSVNLTAKGRGSTAAAFDPNVQVPVRMEFVGRRSGAVTYPGVRGSGRQYRGGNNPINRFHNVHPADVGPLESTGDWRRVAPALPEAIQAAPPKVDQIGPALEAEQTIWRPSGALDAWTPEDGNLTMGVGARATQATEKAAEPVPEPVAVIQTAEGPVKRRVSKRAEKNTALKELPPTQ